MTHAQRDALIQETLPLIKHIAHRVAIRLPSNVEIRDLINAGVLGLMDAISSGLYFAVYDKWFGPKGEAPYPLSAETKRFLQMQVVPK